MNFINTAKYIASLLKQKYAGQWINPNQDEAIAEKQRELKKQLSTKENEEQYQDLLEENKLD